MVLSWMSSPLDASAMIPTPDGTDETALPGAAKLVALLCKRRLSCTSMSVSP